MTAFRSPEIKRLALSVACAALCALVLALVTGCSREQNNLTSGSQVVVRVFAPSLCGVEARPVTDSLTGKRIGSTMLTIKRDGGGIVNLFADDDQVEALIKYCTSPNADPNSITIPSSVGRSR